MNFTMLPDFDERFGKQTNFQRSIISLMELIQHVKLIILGSTHRLLCKVTFGVTLSNIKLLNIFNWM